MQFPDRFALAAAAVFAMAGCASLPPERASRATMDLVDARRDIAPAPTAASAAGDLVQGSADPASMQALSADDAIRIAFLHNPRIQLAYARLGIGLADLEDARRLSNPAFGFSRRTPRRGPGTLITRSLSVEFAELLLLPARTRYAAADLERLQHTVAAELLELASDVETAWFQSVAAAQVAAMRQTVARSAQTSADLAQRYFDAGNINRLQLERERAASTQARIDALGADVDALRARSALAGLLGLPSDASWATLAQLPAPTAVRFEADTLDALALAQRLDLAAAGKAQAIRADAVDVARRWRWLGAVEFGYESEQEMDGNTNRGPSLALSLPIFNQGQGAILRAQSALTGARAEFDALTHSVHNDARLGLDRLRVAYDIVERYRTALLPQREAIVARSQEHVNFMLMGVFELIAAKQDEFDAYQHYLEAVRDYWIARVALKRAVGGRLPDDSADPDAQAPVGIEAILPSAPAVTDPHQHHHSGDTP